MPEVFAREVLVSDVSYQVWLLELLNEREEIVTLKL